jgi:hypothetical protein
MDMVEGWLQGIGIGTQPLCIILSAMEVGNFGAGGDEVREYDVADGSKLPD